MSLSPPARAPALDARATKWIVPLLLLGLAALWFGTLGQRALITPDEGRYATLALGMSQTGDWVTPRLNGFLYFEKPPLQYWLGALAFEAFGVSAATARLWPGLAGFLTVLATGCTAAALWGRRTGLYAVAVAASTTWIAANSHFLTLDAGLTLFLTLCLCAVLLAQRPGLPAEARRRWIWLAWAAMAGATLSKGLIGILIPGAVLVVYSLWQRDFSVWKLHWLSGLALFLALAAPWFVLVSSRNPGFAEFFFVHEHFARYLTTTHRREGAWWYFVPYLLLGLLPWTGGLPWLFKRRKAAGARPRALLLVWIVFIFAFFSLSGSKLPSYILPIFPAFAMLIARALDTASAKSLRWHLLLPTLFWLAVGAVATQADRFADVGTPIDVVAPMCRELMFAAGVFLLAAAAAWWLLARQRIGTAILCVSAGHLLAAFIGMNAHDHYGQLRSSVNIAPALQAQLPADAPVFAVRDYDQSLPFYLRRNVVLVDFVDEFAYGEAHEPGRMVPTLAAFADRWQTVPAAGAVMTDATFRELQSAGLAMRVIYRDARRVAVAKP